MQEFRGLRAWLFPIHSHELKKFLPLSFMMFFIIFNYQILRDTKDTLIVYSAGAEALSLLKLIGTVPGAILIVLVYSKLSTFCSRQQLFYITLIPFLLFFGLFAYVIYPNRHLLHPSSDWIEMLCSSYPRCSTLFYVFGSWSYGLFFVLSELWGSVILVLLFWQLANDIVHIKEAKRFYPLFGLLANFAPVIAGITITHFSTIREHLLPAIDPWGMTLNYLMGAVIVSGVCIVLIYHWINYRVLSDTTLCSPSEGKARKEKSKLSLKESFSYLIQSKHLGYIALIVLCYGISENVIEGVWHEQVRSIHSSQNTYSAFMGHLSFVTGCTTIVFMIIGANTLRLFGWYFSASLTPVIILATGLPFFALVTFKEELAPYTQTFLGMTPTLLAVWLGFFQNVMTKSIKFSLFDSTKEMCYIPLDSESKTKGKAAVDIVGSRTGKSGGAFAQQFLLFVTASSLTGIAPYLAIVCILTVLVWFVAVGRLHTSLKDLQEDQEKVSSLQKATSTAVS